VGALREPPNAFDQISYDRALINRINARLSAEEPFLDVSTAEELLLHLEHAASALDSALSKGQPH
jgi:hypothetical protein